MTAAGVVFFPLIGAIIAGLFGRFIGDRASQLATCAGMVLSALCAWIVLFSVVGTEGYKVDVLTWIHSGTFEADWTLRIDPLSGIMMFVVGGWVLAPITANLEQPAPLEISNTEALGNLLYTEYFYLFQVAGLILLVAIIGAITLTLRHRPGVRRQDISEQVHRSAKDAIEIRKIQPGSGA
jgi:NADH:ubiquinone oxidoreductase subunit 4 (subunit M)